MCFVKSIANERKVDLIYLLPQQHNASAASTTQTVPIFDLHSQYSWMALWHPEKN